MSDILDPKPRNSAKPILIWSGIALAALIFIMSSLTALAYGYDMSYRGKAFRGVYVGGFNLAGLTRDQARSALNNEIDIRTKDGFSFVFEGQNMNVPARIISIDDPDLSRELVTYDLDASLNQAFSEGRRNSLLKNSLERLRFIVRPINLTIKTQANRSLAEQQLFEGFQDRIVTAKDAELEIRISTSSEPVITIQAERIGRLADLTRALDTWEMQAARLAFQPISIKTTSIEPQLTAQKIEQLVDQIPAWLAKAPFTLQVQGRKRLISTSTLAEWITAKVVDDTASLAISTDKLEGTLRPLVADLLAEPRDGKLVLDSNLKVKEFVAPIAGTQIDAPNTINGILEGWKNGSTTLPLVLEDIIPVIQGEDAERLGIREIIGVGRSDFSGSPKNRRYNITLGAKKMSGTIIPPGEEFSQLRALGPVDGAHGWLPELVIKGNRTIPEFGGGLCQIGTTSFRAALASGLEITERRSHSYRVRYYEPAGVDATIYDPSPDFRFKNDTVNHILITSEIRGDNVITSVWGTRDGRQVTQTKPVVYNIVAAPPTKYIETLELAPGQKKCTESAHAGASATFDYTVKYMDDTQKKVTFNSYYRPWGAVCLVGVAALTVPAETGVDLTGTNNPQN